MSGRGLVMDLVRPRELPVVAVEHPVRGLQPDGVAVHPAATPGQESSVDAASWVQRGGYPLPMG